LAGRPANRSTIWCQRSFPMIRSCSGRRGRAA